MGGLTGVIASDALRLAKVVGASAPTMATLLGSPMAGIAVSLLGHAFNIHDGDISAILNAISSDPDGAVKIQEIEAQNAPLLAQLAVANTEDARKYAAGYKDFLRHLAYLVTLGFFCALFLMFIPLNISAEEKNLLSMLVGMLASKWQTIIDFFFGSSSPNYRQGESS